MLTLDQVAEEFGVTRRTVEAWVSERKITVVKMSGRCVRVRPVDVEKAKERFLVVAREPLKGKTK
jgi:excisionase family DNA binding protein